MSRIHLSEEEVYELVIAITTVSQDVIKFLGSQLKVVNFTLKRQQKKNKSGLAILRIGLSEIVFPSLV
jgi:hypothetical protein